MPSGNKDFNAANPIPGMVRDHRHARSPDEVQSGANAVVGRRGQQSIQILGIRWLLQKQRRVGNLKVASSLVIYLKDSIDTNQGVRMGRRILLTTQLQYDWER